MTSSSAEPPADRPSGSGSGRRIKRIATAAVSLGISAAALIYALGKVDTAAVGKVVAAISPASIVLSMLLMWISLAAATARFRLILETKAGISPAFGMLFGLNFLSLFAAHFAPFSAAGDLVKLTFTYVRLKLSAAVATLCTLYDRIVGVLLLFATALVFLAAHAVLPIPRDFLIFETALLAAVAVAGALAIAAAGAPGNRGRPWIGRLSGIVDDIRAQFRLSGGVLSRQALFNIVQVVAQGGIAWLIAGNFMADPPLLLFVALAPIVIIVQNLPFLYAGWGGRELLFLHVLAGVPALDAESILAISVASGVVRMASSLPGAALWLWTSRTGPAAPGGGAAKPASDTANTPPSPGESIF